MAIEDLIREATRAFGAQLTEALEGMAEDLGRAARDDRETAVARATDALAKELEGAENASKDELARAVTEEVARVREEVEEAAIARIEATRVEAQQSADARVEAERAVVRQAADAEISRVRVEAEAAAEVERARVASENERAAETSVAQAVAAERESQLLEVERLLGVVRTLDRAVSLTDVLGALADGAAVEAARVAILTIQGQRALGWSFKGFSPDPGQVDLELSNAGIIGQATATGEVAVAEPSPPGQASPVGPVFAELPADRSGIAVPLVVGGTPVAIIYADAVSETTQVKPAPWPEAIEILARYAAIRLETLTAMRTVQALGITPRAREPEAGAASAANSASGAAADDDGSARRYARLLVSEIKLYNESAVRVGRQKRDLLERLHVEIARARHLFEQRVPAAVRARHDYFDDELVQALADGDPLLLGRPTDALA